MVLRFLCSTLFETRYKVHAGLDNRQQAAFFGLTNVQEKCCKFGQSGKRLR
jgi:hypothetical protein